MEAREGLLSERVKKWEREIARERERENNIGNKNNREYRWRERKKRHKLRKKRHIPLPLCINNMLLNW